MTNAEGVAITEGYEFVNDVKGGVIPREFIPAVEKGLERQ